MPIVRLSRDKRGLDTLYLIDTRQDGRRREGARVLYFWTAPPGLRVGRLPLDPARQRELERRYPDIVFDWSELERAAESARQQAAAATPEARREAWRAAGKSAGRGSAPRPQRNAPAPTEPSRPKASPLQPRRHETGATAVVDTRPLAEASAEESEPPTPAGDALAAAPADVRGETSEADGAPSARRRRRRRPRRNGAADETPRAPDPIIDP